MLRTTSPPAQNERFPDDIGPPRRTIARTESQDDHVRSTEDKSLTIENDRA